MANKKISQLTINTTPTFTDALPIVNSGQTKQILLSGLTNFVSSYVVIITGGTYSNGVAVFTNNTGGTFSVSGFNTTNYFTGGTVTGATTFTNSLSANTVSATTLDVSGNTGYNQFRMRTSYTPTGSTDTNGSIGDVSWDNNYFYWKTSTQWLRLSGETW